MVIIITTFGASQRTHGITATIFGARPQPRESTANAIVDIL